MSLILSLDNSIHSFNTGKFVLDQYTGAAAAYSLRRLSVNSTNVVRVRRSVDNAEDDFTADEVADGTMLNWVNADMPLPLDTATAAAAYSLRNLKTSYTGSVIRVRRSSDNAEADFTADEITDGTLLAWVGNTASDNGYVTTWYDQAGSNSATQGTAANQPKIVDAGVLVEENGRPALEFTTSTEMLTSASGTYSQPNTYFIIAKNNNVNSDFIDGSILVDRNLNDINSGFHRMFAALSFQSTFPNTANQFLRYSLFDGASSEIAIDAASVETGDVGFQGLEKSFRIGDNTSAFLMQELIIYNSDQSSNRTTIETNINDYYNIYAQDRDGFVTTWYDQSGNNDATQATAANQPKIVDAGVLVEENGRPAIDFGTISENKCLTVNTSPITNNFVTIVHNIIYKSNKNQVLLALSNSNYIIITATDAGKLKYVNSNDDMISTTNVGSFQLSTIDINDGKLYTNNLEEDNVTTASGATTRYAIGNYTASSGNELEGYVSEIVTWQTAQTSNRVGIETNINNHYNIYP